MTAAEATIDRSTFREHFHKSSYLSKLVGIFGGVAQIPLLASATYRLTKKVALLDELAADPNSGVEKTMREFSGIFGSLTGEVHRYELKEGVQIPFLSKRDNKLSRISLRPSSMKKNFGTTIRFNRSKHNVATGSKREFVIMLPLSPLRLMARLGKQNKKERDEMTLEA